MVGPVVIDVLVWVLKERLVKGSLNLDFYDFMIYEINWP